jgi:clan AA aspartic protease
MGHTFVNAYLEGTKKGEKMKMLVDTGTTYTTIPKEIADYLGVLIYPEKIKTKLADGREIEVDIGMAMISLNERRAPIKISVMDCEEPLLGVETLEALGLKVNPETEELEPTRSFVMRT